MAKVDELRVKYNTITERTFTKFNMADTTPTKKYLEWMCKTWVNKPSYPTPTSITATKIIDTVQKFEKLNNYLSDKDIYSKENSDFESLIRKLDSAEKIKTEKEFVKEGNIEVLIENDDYVLLRPITHVASLRYGSQTRWCTASKNNASTFHSYVMSGYLLYLINKKSGIGNNYNKIAFYLRFGDGGPLQDQIEIYNQNDTRVNCSTLISNGWDEDEITKIIMHARICGVAYQKWAKSKKQVEDTIKSIKAINLDLFFKNLNIVSNHKAVDEKFYNDSIQTLTEFINKIKENKLTNE
jgi:hypothetical protein